MRITRLVFNKKCGNDPRCSFYATTPIYYVNAAPHIGHLYSSVIADAAARWRRLVDPVAKFKFATGTDEHGTKIQQAAAENKVSLPEYCGSVSRKYRKLSEDFDVDFTDFIRTSDENHVKAVQHFWKTIDSRGHIYSAKYSGWYCVPEETYLTDSQLTESVSASGEKIKVSAESGHRVDWTEEENYMFKLKNFENDLRHWIKQENVVKPAKFQKILLDMLDGGLHDVSVSRPTSRVHWGIKVPNDDTQTVYVWMDALVNYLTATGYPDDAYKDFWPADLQVIGKDILKFHGIYWPAFLMAADIEPPRSILCHSHWTVDGEKMSKSKHNVVCPFNRSLTYTTEGLRYFLLREGVAHSDGNYSDVKVIRMLNAELADTLGNLLSRCCGSALNPGQSFPAITDEALKTVSGHEVTEKLMKSVVALPSICHNHYSEHNFYKVVDATIATLHLANLFFETLKPWELKKDPKSSNQLDVVLHLTLETLRVCSITLSPIVPRISRDLLTKINVPTTSRDWKSTSSLSWNDPAFQTLKLSPEKTILFQRIITESRERGKLKK